MKQTIFRRFTIDKLASVYEEVSNRTFADIRRNKLNNTDFSIYQITVGEDMFIEDMDYYIHHLQ